MARDQYENTAVNHGVDGRLTVESSESRYVRRPKERKLFIKTVNFYKKPSRVKDPLSFLMNKKRSFYKFCK